MLQVVGQPHGIVMLLADAASHETRAVPQRDDPPRMLDYAPAVMSTTGTGLQLHRVRGSVKDGVKIPAERCVQLAEDAGISGTGQIGWLDAKP